MYLKSETAMLARLISLLSMLASGAAFAQLSVQEYPLPSGVGVHDVWADAAPGGPVWFSAQRSGHLGILDPNSGKVTLVSLGENSSPHGVIAGADGSLWLTDGGRACTGSPGRAATTAGSIRAPAR
jgi:virginiamycin B lyase